MLVNMRVRKDGVTLLLIASLVSSRGCLLLKVMTMADSMVCCILATTQAAE
jgi:hypothetical protein